MKKTKRVVALFMALALAVSMAMLSACGGSSSSGNNNANAPKVYTIATDTTFAPFEFQNSEGNYVGIDMDILAAVAADQNFQYTVNALGFDAALQALSSGQADGVIAGMSINDTRKKVFDFSEPYYDSAVVMGISASDDTIKTYDDLKGKKVAAKTNTEGLAFAQSIQGQYGFSIVVFKDSPTMYQDVVAGNSQACFEDYPVLAYGITQGVGLKIVTDKERGSSYGFAVAKGQNAELLQKFNAGLANIKANGKYQAILDKWLGKQTS